jgi:nitrite reductase/ring-hydroxylating ferredoxin subunit
MSAAATQAMTEDTACRFIKICPVAALKAGAHQRFEPEGMAPVCVYNVDGEIYATDDICTHSATASLGEDGELEDHVIECTWHGGRFDIRTGKPLALPCVDPLKTYPVTIEDGEVVIAVSDGE